MSERDRESVLETGRVCSRQEECVRDRESVLETGRVC